MLAGPDGTLYVVDMYRGIVQEQIYWTDFLRDYINARDLEKPVNLGRIWRIVHDTTKRDQTPALSKAPAAELVKTLSHPNGWWRDTAQQLLVERGDASVVPQLKQLATQSADWRARLHALWTLDGLDAIERRGRAAGAGRQVAGRARGRGPACRSAGSTQPNHPLAPPVLKLVDDPSWTVRRQLAATIGELPQPARPMRPLTALLTRTAPIRSPSTSTISGLRGDRRARS